MTTSHTAQGLASLGRNGDSILVHMSPHEVAGLNYLAKKQGTKLTINPTTGLPEAFNLGGFFSSFLPMFAGMAFAPGTGGFSMAPLLAGAATGAGLAAVKGEDPLMGGLMGGLGGYGGGQLGPALGAAAPGGYVAGQAVQGAANPLMNTAVNTTLSGVGNSMMTNPLITNAANSISQAGLGVGSGIGFIDKGTQNIMNAGSGLKNLATGADQAGAWNAFKAAGGTPTQLALPVGGAVLSGLEPSDLYGKPMQRSDKEKYDPYATLNLSGDTGLRLYAVGGTVTSGGLRDLYGAADNNTNPQLSRDGYGVGRLDSLAREQAMTQAQTTGYADGGDVVAGERGMNLTDLPSLNVNTGEQGYGGKSYYMTPDGSGMYAGRFFKDAYRQSPNPLFKLFSRLPNDTVFTRQMAQGGPVSFADGGDTEGVALEQLGTPTDAAAPSQLGIAALANSAQMDQQGQAPTDVNFNAPPIATDGSIITQIANNLKVNPNYEPKNPIEAAIVKQLKGTDSMQEGQQGLGSIAPAQPSFPTAATYNPVQAMGPTYFAGLNAPQGYAEGGETSLNLDDQPTLNVETDKQSYNTIQSALANSDNPQGRLLNRMFSTFKDAQGRNIYDQFAAQGLGRLNKPQMAKGGYLDGQGDGMSDSIPATIEGKQPARLADGEFVVPADVVSHIGNGSSKAGSKRLYAMLDKVRHARTGNKKQGREINPNKYLPA